LYFCALGVYIVFYLNCTPKQTIPSLTGSLTGTKLESLHGRVGQDGLFLMSIVILQLMFTSLTGSLTGTTLESLDGNVGQDSLFIL